MESPHKLSILQISDLHILPNPKQTMLGIDTEYYFHRVLEHAFCSGFQFDLILVTGDLTQHPLRTSYQRILNGLDAYDVPCVCLPGNHDDYALMQQVFNTDKINCSKQIVFKDWQLICLNSQIENSPDGELGRQELDFLEAGLTSHPNQHALIATHHHCLPTGSAWLDTMMIKDSTALFARIASYPQIKAIVNGHIHQIMDSTVNKIRILAAPSTCFQFKPNSEKFCVEPTPPGYRVLQLYDNGAIESEVFRLSETLMELDFSNNGY